MVSIFKNGGGGSSEPPLDQPLLVSSADNLYKQFGPKLLDTLKVFLNYCIKNIPGFYTKLNVWGSLGLNFEYDGVPSLKLGVPSFYISFVFWKVVHPSVKARSCPQVSNFEGHVLPPSDFFVCHLKFLRATYYHQ